MKSTEMFISDIVKVAPSYPFAFTFCLLFRVLQTLRHLVALNESLKKQESEFRVHCKEEMSRLQENINKVKMSGGEDVGDSEEMVRSGDLKPINN